MAEEPEAELGLFRAVARVVAALVNASVTSLPFFLQLDFEPFIKGISGGSSSL